MRFIVSLIISASLILTPCFAFADTASGSALTLDEQLWIMNEGGIKPVQVAAIEVAALGDGTRAAGDPGTSTNPYYFLTPGRNATVYYSTNSTSSTSTTYYVDDLGDVVQGITQSIAYSVQNQRNLWSTIGTNTVSAINDVYNRIGTIGGYVDGIEGQMTTSNTYLGSISNNVSNVKSKVDSIYTAVDNLEGYTDNVENTLSSILTAIQNQSFTIPQILLDNVQDIHDNQVTSSTFNANTGWTGITAGGTYTLPRYRQVANGGTSSDLTPVTDARNPISNIWYMANNINTSMVYGLRDLLSGISVNSTAKFKDYNLQDVSLGRQSLWYDIRVFGINLNNSLSRLAYVFANDDEIAARQAAAANTAAAVSNVISSSGSGSAKPADISGIANLKSSVTDSISTGAYASTVFNELGSDGDAWGWFSQACQDELSAPSRRSSIRSDSKSSVSDTPMLDAYYHDLEEALGFKLW